MNQYNSFSCELITLENQSCFAYLKTSTVVDLPEFPITI